MNPQPLISVSDVKASSRWYQEMLGLSSGHGGPEYEQLLADGRMVMQLHAWDVHEHPHLGSAERHGRGNGVALWFQTERFDQALARIQAQTGHAAHVLEGPMVNPLARHREIWLRDPDGYVVVVAGAHGDLGPATPAN
ncbi:MAG: VOC family protein [Burkholderiaceae bacterium]|nr:VOC family protein [Burkholderiaceae bacterium]